MIWKTFSTALLLFTNGLVFSLAPVAARAESPGASMVAVSAPGNWQSVTSESGLFSVEMPQPPSEQTRQTEISGQPKTWTLLEAQSGDEVYAVAYLDLSRSDLQTGARGTLRSLRDAVLSQVGLQAFDLNGRRISLNGYPGREYVGIQGNQVAAVRLYLVNERLYGLVAKSDDIAQINQFFTSFQVEPRWQEFSSETGRFLIQLPAPPTAEIEPLKAGEYTLNWSLLRSSNILVTEEVSDTTAVDDVEDIYAVGYTDLPAGWSQEDSRQVLNQIGSPLLNRLNLQLLSNRGRAVSLGGYQGREFLGVEAGRIFAVRLYQVDQRVYGLISVSSDLTSIDRFFNSFQIF